MENVILRNNSPQACDWVCLPQDSAPGTEMVSLIKRQFLILVTHLEF